MPLMIDFYAEAFKLELMLCFLYLITIINFRQNKIL